MLIALVAAGVFFYSRPLTTWFGARSDLDARQAEIAALRQEKSELEIRLARFTSTDAMRLEARRIGFVRRGEQLFVVKGIPEWRRRHAR
jgi:cell division protein FtsB